MSDTLFSKASVPSPLPAAQSEPDASPPSSTSVPTSINSIIRQHPRQRLYVWPLLWRQQHVDLLGLVFTQKRGSQRRKMDGSTSDSPLRWAKSAYECLQPGSRDSTAIAVARAAIKELGFSQSGYHMPLAFARHRACDLDTDGVFAQTPTSSAMLAFLHYRTIRSLRDRLVSSTGRQPSPPMRRVHNKRLAGLEPRLPVQDPYVAGVLIALAQAQANASSTGPADAPTPSSTGSTFRTLLLVAFTRGLILYTADIPSAFLDRFDRPGHESLLQPVTIEYRRLLSPAAFVEALTSELSGTAI